jgi:hypothetical protein
VHCPILPNYTLRKTGACKRYVFCQHRDNPKCPAKGGFYTTMEERVIEAKVGYCMICGVFVQRLADYNVSGLCDECINREWEKIRKFFKLEGQQPIWQAPSP